MKKQDISVQLYTTRKFQPYLPILNFIKESGVVNLELFGLESMNIDEFKNMMESNNITSHSTHVGFEALQDTKNIVDRAKKLNIKHVIVPAPPAKKDGEFNTVSVADQGIGIPKESIHRITERFFTVDPSKSRSVGGTGLGLAIVKHLVSQHRAEMDINSVENEGTTIDIKFNPL